jgi:hypothetical protein
MEVDGRLWHKDCFRCQACGELLKKFVEREDKVSFFLFFLFQILFLYFYLFLLSIYLSLTYIINYNKFKT